MLDAATGKFGQGLQLRDHGADFRMEDRMKEKNLQTSSLYSRVAQSESERGRGGLEYESVLEIHFNSPNTQRLGLEARSVNIRACGPLPTCEELYNPATALEVVDRF